MENNRIELLHNFALDRADIDDFVEILVTEITEGSLNPLKAAVRLKVMEDIVKGVRSNKDVKNAVITLLEEQGKYEEGRATVSLVDTASFDYSEDPVWAELKQKETHYAALRKQRETVLKTVTSEFPDPINEGVTLKPPTRTATKTSKVNIK